jgi:hypothetical protein
MLLLKMGGACWISAAEHAALLSSLVISLDILADTSEDGQQVFAGHHLSLISPKEGPAPAGG